MKNFARTATRAAAAAAIGLTVAAVTAGPAAASVDSSWHYVRTYATAAACAQDGHTAVRDGSADAYRCDGTKLYLKY